MEMYEEEFCLKCCGLGYELHTDDKGIHYKIKCPKCKGLGRINKIKIIGKGVEKKRSK